MKCPLAIAATLLACTPVTAQDKQEALVLQPLWSFSIPNPSQFDPLKEDLPVFNRSAALADLDSDGQLDIVAVNLRDGVIVLKDKAGTPEKVWAFDTKSDFLAEPSVGDLDGDGILEVVVGSQEDQTLYVLQAGEMRWKFSLNAASPGDYPQFDHASALADIDGDGTLEVVATTNNGLLLVIKAPEGTQSQDGRLLWSHNLGFGSAASPAIGDLNQDGLPEVIATSIAPNTLSVFKHDGAELWKWEAPVNIWTPPVVGDVDGDGRPEVVIGTGVDDNAVYVLNDKDGDGAGNVLWRFSDCSNRQISTAPLLANLDDDPGLEVIAAADCGQVYIIDNTGARLLGKFDTGGEPIATGFALADLNGDQTPEIIFGTGFFNGQLVVVDASGTKLLGWSYDLLNGILAAPVLGDINGDGRLDLVIGYSDRFFGGANYLGAFTFNTATIPHVAIWPTYQFDNKRTGRFELPATPVHTFLRGDANGDLKLDLSDAVTTLGSLFLGYPLPSCRDAADTNDDGVLDISDAVFTLNFLFSGGREPPLPGYLIPGPDPTTDALGC